MPKGATRARKIENLCNSIEVAGVAVVLLIAFCLQVVLDELPCPLCLLQRIGFFLIATGFLMNLRFGLHPSHYAMVILGCVYTCLVALRQIALHIVPGTGSYGFPIFGLHLYTWSFIGSVIILVITTFLMSVDRQYLVPIKKKNSLYTVTNALFAILILLLIMNIIGVLYECGLSQCPDNPTKYL